jgi:hypothetical protein
LTGRGWIPAGLDGIDYTSSMLLKCAAAKMITSPSNVIALPAERRTDSGYEPRGYAIVEGARVDTSIGFAVDVATLGTVAGASFYQVEYFPEITVFATLSNSGVTVTNADYSWQIKAEQV